MYDDAVTGMGTWTFQRTPSAVGTRHPVGTTTRMGGGYSPGDVGGGADGWDVFAAFYLRGTDEESGTVVLQGTLYRGEVAGRCVFTRMTGTVYEYNTTLGSRLGRLPRPACLKYHDRLA